jgi:hypothetical protein
MIASCAAPSADEGKHARPSGAAGGDVGALAQALTPPSSGCTSFDYNAKKYWFCPLLKSWQSARSECQSIGYDLAGVESAAENAFIRSHLLTSAWTGGNDRATEGQWRWASSNVQFWQGSANGSAVGGAYKNWKTFEPNNTLDQDCQRIDVLDGRWADENCNGLLNYVCEGDGCPADPNKTDPGQCGCGVSDTDGDGDGTADCDDLCPNDATKTAPGLCGCGVSDADGDGDGTPNCQDQCPTDAKKIVAGDCGCANAPRPSGTACDDGQCAANAACDGAGTCGTPAQCGVPDTQCTFALRGGIGYWFCNNLRSFTQARQKCQAVGMDLAAVESAGEDAFIGTKTVVHAYLSGSDQAAEGAWSWLATTTPFWSGNRNGSPVASAYTNWDLLQPDDLLRSNDCLVKDPPLLGGKWESRACNLAASYVCERIDFCPDDPNKFVPGQCGCGTADTDTDHDGTADCNDTCPSDAGKTAPGQCGCGTADTDTDHDGTADCADACPADPANTSAGNCGCVGQPGLKAAGTPCYDGYCDAAGTTCDGAGSCGSKSACMPVADCTPRTYHGKLYAVCPTALSWQAARASCQSHPDMDLARIETPEENAAVIGGAGSYWLGASDAASEGTWRWADNDEQLWAGDQTGDATMYTNFAMGEPSNSAANRDCAAARGADKAWTAEDCATTRPYICEVHKPKRVAAPGAVINSLNGISDPLMRARVSYATFATQKAMCNVANGIVVSDLERMLSQGLTSQLSPAQLPGAMQMIGQMCDNLPDPAVREDLMDDFAFADPLDEQIFAASDSIGVCDVGHVLNTQPSRLRANFCDGGGAAEDRAVSLSSRLTTSLTAPDDDHPFFERHAVDGAPVVIGLDDIDGFNQFGDVQADRNVNRTPNGPPGDGYSMYGVRTDIPCTTGSCDATLGQLCSNEAPGHGPVAIPDPSCDPGDFGNPCPPIMVNHCIAYPLVQNDDEIKLIGHNFWDPCSARLVMRELGGSDERTLSAVSIGTAGEPTNNDDLACTPSPDGVRLAAANIAASSSAVFGTRGQSLPRNRFYTLQMFNRNGTFSAQHDIQERGLQGASLADLGPRTMHVCWDCDPNVSDTDCPRVCTSADDTHCTLARCSGPITQTCQDDACAGSQVSECDPPGGPRDGSCTAGLWPVAPRGLDNPLCTHEPNEPARCAETPQWLGAAPHPQYGFPIIFLADAGPDYRVTVSVQRIKCQQETGVDCFFCRDDNLVGKLTTQVQGGSGNPVMDPTWDIDTSFDEGDAKNYDAIVSRAKIKRNQALQWELAYTEADNFALEAVIGTLVLSGVGALINPWAAAAGGTIGTTPIYWSDYIEGEDIMGTDAWRADLPRLLQAHGDSRAPDLLVEPPFLLRKPIASIEHDESKWERKWPTELDRLMHPFDTSYRGELAPTHDITRDNWIGAIIEGDAYFAKVRQCGPHYTGALQCTADKCFAGRCTNAAVDANGCHPQDQFCGLDNAPKGFFERRDIAGDADAGEARYIWDFKYTIETCDANVSPSDTSVCEPLP